MPLEGVVQADETFMGGKNKNRHADKKVPNSQGRSVKDKTPVFGLADENGKVKTQVIPNTQTIRNCPMDFILGISKDSLSMCYTTTERIRSFRNSESEP